VPGASSPAALQLRGKNYPLPLSGTIWIEPQSGAVAKLVASMDASLSDLGLQAMRSEIHYATVHFHDPEESYWMPVSASSTWKPSASTGATFIASPVTKDSGPPFKSRVRAKP